MVINYFNCCKRFTCSIYLVALKTSFKMESGKAVKGEDKMECVGKLVGISEGEEKVECGKDVGISESEDKYEKLSKKHKRKDELLSATPQKKQKIEIVHKKIKPFTCKQCGKSFMKQIGLEIHKRNVHVTILKTKDIKRIVALKEERNYDEKEIEISCER